MEDARFGRYRLIELLGRGGMGEVHRAFDTETYRVVALKMLPKHLANDQEFQRRFRREAQAAAGLNDPHVVPIHNYGEIDGRLYVDMRLIEGRDLEVVLRAGPMPSTRAVKIVEQVAEALMAAHRIGLVHRDVKPSNILVTDGDFAYLIDFGVARAAGQSSLTQAGSAVGTCAYMAPERFTNNTIDPRVDTYALACVLFECIAGRRPFPGDGLDQQIAGHVSTPPPRLSAFAPGAASLDAVVARGMAKNPQDRYATVRDLAKAARAAVTTPIPPPRRPAGPGQAPAKRPFRLTTQHKIAALIVVAAILAAVALLAVAESTAQVASDYGQDSESSLTTPNSMLVSAVNVSPGAGVDVQTCQLRSITCSRPAPVRSVEPV